MLKPVLAALVAASFLTLGACTQETRVEDEPTAEQAIENAGDSIEQAGDNAANEIEQAGENAEQSIENATDDNPSTTP
jgi:outer membrane murein-binding lipoprotein Lpp